MYPNIDTGSLMAMLPASIYFSRSNFFYHRFSLIFQFMIRCVFSSLCTCVWVCVLVYVKYLYNSYGIYSIWSKLFFNNMYVYNFNSFILSYFITPFGILHFPLYFIYLFIHFFHFILFLSSLTKLASPQLTLHISVCFFFK